MFDYSKFDFDKEVPHEKIRLREWLPIFLVWLGVKILLFLFFLLVVFLFSLDEVVP